MTESVLFPTGSTVSTSPSSLQLYQSSISPIPHAEPPSPKKSNTVYNLEESRSIRVKFGGLTHILPTPQEETDESGVKKSSTEPIPRIRVPRSIEMRLEQQRNTAHKTGLYSTLISQENRKSAANSSNKKYVRKRKNADWASSSKPLQAFTSSNLHRKKVTPLYPVPCRANGNTEDKLKDIITNLGKRIPLHDPVKASTEVGLGDAPFHKRDITMTQSTASHSEKWSEDKSEHRMLDGLLTQYSPFFGTDQEKSDRESTIKQIEKLTQLSAMAPKDFDPLNIRASKLSNVDVSIGEMKPWDLGYQGEQLKRFRIVEPDKSLVREESLYSHDQGIHTRPFIRKDRQVRHVIAHYFERFPKFPYSHSRLLSLRIPLIKRFPKLPAIDALSDISLEEEFEKEHEKFPESEPIFPADLSEEYSANREPIAPKEGQLLDEPEPAPEPVPEPEPAPIPELPFIKEIPPIPEPEAPTTPNLDPKKTFDSGKSNGGVKKSLQIEQSALLSR